MRAYDVRHELMRVPPTPGGQVGRPHCFLIRTAASIYYIQSSSKDEMQGWIDAISDLQAAQNSSTPPQVVRAASPLPAATKPIVVGPGSAGRPARKESSVELVSRGSDQGRSRTIPTHPQRRLTMDIDEGDDDTDATVYGM